MQTSYALDPAIGREGQLADSRDFAMNISKLAVGAIKAGKGVFKALGFGSAGPANRDPGSVIQNPSPPLAVNTTALLATGGVSSASIQVYSGAAFNGAFGQQDLQPARQATVIFSNNANWSATNASLVYVNERGLTVTEVIAIPASGNVTRTTTGLVKRLVSLTIPVQGGAAGTFTIGTVVVTDPVLADFEGLAIYDAACATVIFPNQNGVAEYRDQDTVSVMRKGAMYVISEELVVAGDPVFVRVVAGAGGTQVGALRKSADTASAVQIVGARFARDAAAGAITIVELY